MPTRVPKTLYHYCSLQTFKSIVENRSIWLSDVSKSNDSRELSWIKSQSVERLFRSWLEYLKTLKEKNKFEEISQLHFSQFDEIRNLAANYDASKCWTFCMSAKGDDLGQWRGYADDGCGVAIGFDSQLFMAFNALAEGVDKNTELHFRKVNYSAKSISDFFDKTCQLDQINKDMSPDEVLSLYRNMVGITIWHAPFFKHEKFKDEKEWRLVYTMSIPDIAKGVTPCFRNIKEEYNNLISFGGIGYTIRNNNLVSHVELKIPPIDMGITKIILGPKCKIDAMEIRMFLASLGFNVTTEAEHQISIIKSDASYR